MAIFSAADRDALVNSGIFGDQQDVNASESSAEEGQEVTNEGDDGSLTTEQDKDQDDEGQSHTARSEDDGEGEGEAEGGGEQEQRQDPKDGKDKKRVPLSRFRKVVKEKNEAAKAVEEMRNALHEMKLERAREKAELEHMQSLLKAGLKQGEGGGGDEDDDHTERKSGGRSDYLKELHNILSKKAGGKTGDKGDDGKGKAKDSHDDPSAKAVKELRQEIETLRQERELERADAILERETQTVTAKHEFFKAPEHMSRLLNAYHVVVANHDDNRGPAPTLAQTADAFIKEIEELAMARGFTRKEAKDVVSAGAPKADKTPAKTNRKAPPRVESSVGATSRPSTPQPNKKASWKQQARESALSVFERLGHV